MEYKDGEKPEELSPRVKANMERCANFLVEMVEKYGRGLWQVFQVKRKKDADKWDKARHNESTRGTV